MSTFDYSKSQAIAVKLITKFGTMLKVGGVSTIGVFTTPKKVLPTNQTGAGGSLLAVEQADKVIIIPGTIKRVPLIGDIVSSEKEDWKVIRVEEVKPADVTVIYKLEVTK